MTDKYAHRGAVCIPENAEPISESYMERGFIKGLEKAHLVHGSLITWLNESLCARVVKILRLKTKIQNHSKPFICVTVINKRYLGLNNTNSGVHIT